MLPDDTLAMYTLPDFHAAMIVWSNSPQFALWNDPSLQAFRNKFTDKLKTSLLDPLEHELGVHFDDYTDLPQGQVTFALVQNGWKGSRVSSEGPALVFLMDAREKSARLKTNLADLRRKWVDAGKTVKNTKIRDVDFSAVTVSPSDIPKSLRPAPASTPADGADSAGDTTASPKNKSSLTLYIGQADSLLVVSDSTKVIEKILGAMSDSGVKTLSQVATYAANRDSMFRNAVSYGWVNLQSLVDILKHSVPDELPADSGVHSPDSIIAALGFDGLKSAAFSSSVAKDGVQFDFLLSVPDDARSGLFKLIADQPRDCSPPPFVPADVVKFERYRLDGPKAWEGLRKIISEISSEAIGAVDVTINSAEASAKEKNPDFDIKRDLFANLGDDFITYQKKPRGSGLADLSSPPTIYLISSPNPDKLASALGSLIALIGPSSEPREREFLGRKIYTISAPLTLPGVVAAAAGVHPTLSYASGTSYLAISTDGTMIEEFLRSGEDQGKSLRDAPGLTAASRRVSAQSATVFGYSNDGEAMRSAMTVLKSDSGATQFTATMDLLLNAALGRHGDSGLGDWLDFTLLPDYSRVSKYFSFTVYTAGATPDGLVMKSFTPSPSVSNN